MEQREHGRELLKELDLGFVLILESRSVPIVSGNKKEKEDKLNKIGHEMMCRIASLLPENRRGHFKDEKAIHSFQEINNIIPDHHFYFKATPEQPNQP